VRSSHVASRSVLLTVTLLTTFGCRPSDANTRSNEPAQSSGAGRGSMSLRLGAADLDAGGAHNPELDDGLLLAEQDNGMAFVVARGTQIGLRLDADYGKPKIKGAALAFLGSAVDPCLPTPGGFPCPAFYQFSAAKLGQALVNIRRHSKAPAFNVGLRVVENTDIGVCKDLILVPDGVAPRVCVHEVPKGAAIIPNDAGLDVVTRGTEILATFPACPCDDFPD
jgi:hypothetical protein